jgi:hypothetical protein
MNPIFLVVGPPAVGKSTTSRALAARFPKSLHIPVDDLRDMVVSGIELPGVVWNDALTQQLSLARTSAVQMALNYHNAGFAVTLDDFVDPGYLADYSPLFSHPEIHRVVLFPQQEAAHQRNLLRSGETPARAYIDQGIQIVYPQLKLFIPQMAQAGWIVIDSTHLSLEETVTTILQRANLPA